MIQALSQLEVGSVGVMGFGDAVRFIHPLQPAQCAASGALATDATNWMHQFTFAQANTKIAQVSIVQCTL